MSYTTINFKMGKDLKDAFEAGERIAVFQPGPFGPKVQDGNVYLEGPHYPEAHMWYASGTAKNGVLTSLKSVDQMDDD